ncbi:MAG: hypothetical protein OXI26_00045 [bacterium]|nr:hypothetical protein [bacterium]
MLAIILLSLLVPTLAGVAFMTLRNRHPELLADAQGIALQTVIIIVVLLAIAGAIAGVLITRGDQAVEDLQRQDTDISAQYLTGVSCRAAGHTWTANPGANADANGDGDTDDRGEGTCG